MKNTTHKLGTLPIPKLLLSISLPAIIAMVVQGLYNMVDRFFVGNFTPQGEEALAGISLGFPIVLFMMGVGMLVGMGGSSLFSISLGQEKEERAEKLLGTSILILLILSVFFALLSLLFLEDLLLLLGADPLSPAFGLSLEYNRIILSGAPLMCLGFGINAFIRGEGNAMRGMTNILAGAILNMILDPLFIIHFKMGIQGAAYATILSQGLTAFLVLEHFFRGNSRVKFHFRNLVILPQELAPIFAIGSSGFLMQVAASFMNGLLNNQLQTYGPQLGEGFGNAGITAMGIIYPLGLFFLMPIFGINQGSQPILGYNHGAKKPQRVMDTVLWALSFATLVLFIGFLLFQLFPNFLIQSFVGGQQSMSPQLALIGSRGLKTFYLLFPLLGLQIIGSGFFISLGDAGKALALTLSRQLLLIFFLFLLPQFFGFWGIFYAAPAADFVAILITTAFFLPKLLQLKEEGRLIPTPLVENEAAF